MTTPRMQTAFARNQKVRVVAGYELQQTLGSGSFATVYKGVRTSQQQQEDGAQTVAVKAITREKLTKKVLENLEMEISILRTYQHPNIVCLQRVQKTEHHFYLVLEYCGGGDLQRLIRTRLVRRLMRDLSSGLRFLWGQELIHRDLKPQNLLLTGPLPLDEIYDPAKMDVEERMRQEANFPSAQFSLKIADFGFARHLQTASLAETLCGSPLYMAPEILLHQRYDAKADLWSVGTVLFEMIAGRPPFNGDNQMHLLRNIQHKAVRLPADVRVSKQCVNLLKMLLNRNPLSRAGFKEFFEACDAFVALGCEGSAPAPSKTTCGRTDLGTIHEDTHNAASMVTVETTSGTNPRQAAQPQPQQTLQPPHSIRQTQQQQPVGVSPHVQVSTGYATPPFGPAPSPAAPPMKLGTARGDAAKFAPLQPSPPQVSQPHFVYGNAAPVVPMLEGRSSSPGHIQLTTYGETNNSASQNSTDDSGFVMVEHAMPEDSRRIATRPLAPSPPASPRQRLLPTPQLVVSKDRLPRGMLSTSPGTGVALVGMTGGRPRLTATSNQTASQQQQVESTTIAAAEDVGRRAISVAHLGDTRVYIAMRLLMGGASGSSLFSAATPMEGVEEEKGEPSLQEEDNRPVSSDFNMTSAHEEEMPFAVPSDEEENTMAIPSRTNTQKPSSLAVSKPVAKPNPEMIRAHFGEALSCYLKSLSMLKSVLGAVQRVKKEVTMSTNQRSRTQLLKRCDVTANWLSGQFNGVLERADAASTEIAKLASSRNEFTYPVLSVEELIYNHALACGRDGAVKQLLGQHDAARSCYRTAGLLAETLLMEPKIGKEDRLVLEGYVDGFAARIVELDENMLQSRGSGSEQQQQPKRGSGVIGLIGGIPPPPGGAGVIRSVVPPHGGQPV
eukprot:CAMPEP_0116869670 /NCGR_PEP_ID=MMETSP0418-20121206/27886_1 /TAXON_ID=1158023 /ORGANISM="Astrosyne radiata, Strain 13vi08-1A" /LENGTH=894 /DNA_ID=CAMNT_0004505787 /DNA_START=59 /DNA_END=2743 /DNA_ORIENTATION=+